LRDQFQCYFHSRISRGVQQRPDLLLDAMSVLESPEAVQYSLMLVVDGLLKNRIEPVKARLIIHTLRIAARNVKACRFDGGHDMGAYVTDVPDYAEQCAEEKALLSEEEETTEDETTENESEVSVDQPQDTEEKAEPPAPVRKYPPQPAASTTTMIERAQAAISGAEHGNWRDLRTALELAGIKPPTTDASQQE
jgi:hypothetical protein